MTHTSTDQPEARDLAYWIAHTTDNPTAALIQSLHARVQELEAERTARMTQNDRMAERIAEQEAQVQRASQAQRVPLSERKIRQIDAHSGLDAIEFARAIERAHGIQERST